MTRASIGLRLTLWYAALLASALAAFGVLAIWQLHRSVIQSADTKLEQVFSGTERVLSGSKAGSEDLKEELNEYADELRPDVILDVRYAGSSLTGSGRNDAAPNDEYRTLFRSVTIAGYQYSVSAKVSIRSGLTMIREFSQAVAVFVPLLLFFACGAGYWISRRALRPVDALTGAARSLGVENLSSRLPVPRARDELQRLSEAWNEMLARLEDSVQRLSRFTADASHEMRSPLAVIRAAAEVALRRERSAPEYREALSEILRQVVRLSHLVEDLLTLARTEQGAMPSFSLVDLAAVVHDACDQLIPIARGRAVSVAAAVEPRMALVQGYEPSIRRLVLILLDNAIKFSPNGGHVSVRIQERDGPAIELAVEDNGPGIAAEHLPHIFERFYRVDGVRTPGTSGAGLGLSLARSIAESHHTGIQVETAVGQGSVFRVAFSRAA